MHKWNLKLIEKLLGGQGQKWAWTLKLAKSQGQVVGINWFSVCGYKFKEA